MGRLRTLLRRRGVSPSRGARVAYAPERDGDPDPGEVVWAWVPYEDDPSQGKDRPVLVIGYGPGRDGEPARPLAVPLSSKDPHHKRDADEWVEVGAGGWDREHRVSYANADRVMRFPVDGVRREGAALPRDRFDAVVLKARQLGRLG
jgi:mRNA-degrading endonuclease toxin of MazEF toxin-antitoxin module